MRDRFGKEDKAIEVLLKHLNVYKEVVDLNFVCSVTDHEGNIIYVNDKFCQISKYSREELLGKNHRIVNSKHHSSDFFREMWQTIKNGKVWRGEVKSKTKDGLYFWLDSTIVPIHDQEGGIIEFFSLRVPVDEKKRIEEEQQEYVRSLERMLFMVSHKVRQPVCQILGIANILESGAKLDDEHAELITYLKEASLSLEVFTRELTVVMHNMRPENDDEQDYNQFEENPENS